MRTKSLVNRAARVMVATILMSGAQFIDLCLQVVGKRAIHLLGAQGAPRYDEDQPSDTLSHGRAS